MARRTTARRAPARRAPVRSRAPARARRAPARGRGATSARSNTIRIVVESPRERSPAPVNGLVPVFSQKARF